MVVGRWSRVRIVSYSSGGQHQEEEQAWELPAAYPCTRSGYNRGRRGGRREKERR